MKTDATHSFDARNKVVSFRLSDNEYELASEFCKASGFRGMSMLARAAFLAYLPQPGELSNGHEDPVRVQAELRNLHGELDRLISSLSRIQRQMTPDEKPVALAMAAEQLV